MGTGQFGISSTLMEVFGVARGAGEQIFRLINNVPNINPLLNRGFTPATIDGSIELKNVVFHYPTRPDVPVRCYFNPSTSWCFFLLLYKQLYLQNTSTAKIIHFSSILATLKMEKNQQNHFQICIFY